VMIVAEIGTLASTILCQTAALGVNDVLVVKTRTSLSSLAVLNTKKYALPLSGAPCACAARSGPSTSKSGASACAAPTRGTSLRAAGPPTAQVNMSGGELGIIAPSFGAVNAAAFVGSVAGIASSNAPRASSLVPPS